MLKVPDGNKFDWVNIPLDECMKGNAQDTYYTAKVYGKLLKDIRAKGLEKLYDKIISPVTPIFRDMEYNGILIDEVELAKLKAEIQAKLEKISGEMLSVEGIPPNSKLTGDDLIKILYSLKKNKDKEWEVDESVGFQLYPFSMTDKGQPKTDEETLIQMKELVDKEFLRRGLNEKQ
jgi:DNA polymerase I-like protein with 3'-5' exonuclease and polymerase domains